MGWRTDDNQAPERWNQEGMSTRGRGHGRGRGDRGTGWGRGRGRGAFSFNKGRDLPPPRDLREGLLEPALVELDVPEDVESEEHLTIEDFECVGSYSWTGNQDATILVPGK